MKKRQLGRSKIHIAPLVFGGNIFGWTVDEPTSHRLLDAFVDGGFNAIDTANVYSTWVPGHRGGESEAIIGSWLKQRKGRQKIVIATKVGKKMSDGSKGLSKANIVKSAEDSLRRLQTDYIDLYQSHDDDETVEQSEILEAYLALIGQGKVRVIGASNFTGRRLSDTLDLSVRESFPRYESMQPCYNLYDRWEYEGVCKVSVSSAEWASSATFPWPAAFLPENTAQSRTWQEKHAAKTWRSISTRAGSASFMPWIRWRSDMRPRLRRLPSPG
jgi:aryl-alcohol dehydrogenase-like predicted oxidoreductase